MNNQPDIEAEVIFLSPSEGGRKNSVFQGFRPTFFYDGNPWDADLYFEGADFLPDGKPRIVYFKFASPEKHVGQLLPGKHFELWDGRVIAEGKVLKILTRERSAKNGP